MWLAGFPLLKPSCETITIHILANISGSECNKTFNRIFFFKNHAENEAARLVPDLLLFF